MVEVARVGFPHCKNHSPHHFHTVPFGRKSLCTTYTKKSRVVFTYLRVEPHKLEFLHMGDLSVLLHFLSQSFPYVRMDMWIHTLNRTKLLHYSFVAYIVPDLSITKSFSWRPCPCNLLPSLFIFLYFSTFWHMRFLNLSCAFPALLLESSISLSSPGSFY